MTIIVFLVDTSASMNQRTYLGTSLLDFARDAVETFLKLRVKDAAARGMDRYMLLTFDAPPNNIRAGWRENQATFHEQLKNLRARGLTNFGQALGEALRYLNLNRLTTGIDYYGHGRYPFYVEPAVVIAITDGAPLTSAQGIQTELTVPKPLAIGNELTKEPFHWDQRVFSLVLRLPGHHTAATQRPPPPPGAQLPHDSAAPAVNAMCQATGGRSFLVSSHRMLNACIETLMTAIQNGVVVRLEKHGPDPPIASHTVDDLESDADLSNLLKPVENGFLNDSLIHNHKTADVLDAIVGKQPTVAKATMLGVKDSPTDSPTQNAAPWHCCSTVIYVKPSMRSSGHWPVPEDYWPDPSLSVLPPRNANAIIRYKCEAQEPLFSQEFPFDKYELQPNALTDYILSRKEPNTCWQLFVQGSGRMDNLGFPFGYLKASSALTVVNLLIMPYNYPVLLNLLEECKTSGGRPSQTWRNRFSNYLRSVPSYYYLPLKKALSRLNLAGLIPDSEQICSYEVLGYLAKTKLTAKEELDRTNALVSQTLASATATEAQRLKAEVVVESRNTISLAARVTRLGALSSDTVDQLKAELNEFHGFRISLTADARLLPNRPGPSSMFRNPFDIPRTKLLEQVKKMRINLKQHLSRSSTANLCGALPGKRLRLQHAEYLHNLPISQMGNYQEYLKQIEASGRAPLREVEATPVRAHAFGNPFKIDKKAMMVDEADIDIGMGAGSVGMGSGSGSAGGGSGSIGGGGSRGARVQKRPLADRQHRRKPGPLTKDALERYKRRRRSNSSMSSASSVASDIDDFDDRLSVASTSMEDMSGIESNDDRESDERKEKLQARLQPNNNESTLPSDDNVQGNGGKSKAKRAAQLANGRGPKNRVKEEQQSKVTKKRPNDAARLTTKQLQQRRTQLRAVVRRSGNVDFATVLRTAELDGGAEMINWQDKLLLLEHARNEADRFKRRRLVDSINRCIGSLSSENGWDTQTRL